MRRTTMLSLIAILLAVSAVAGAQEDLQERSDELKKEVTKVRGLEFKAGVKAQMYTKDELVKFMKEEFDRELPRPRAEKYERAMVHFGLMPADLDLYDSLMVLVSESIAAYYHPKTKELRLVETEKDPLADMYKKFGLDMEAFMLVHELTHAAQDQQFDLYTLPIQERHNTDLATAVKCLVEGDASVAGCEYAQPLFSGVLKSQFPTPGKFIEANSAGYRSGMLPGKAGELPRYLRMSLCFPYGYAPAFILAVREGKEEGWKGIDAIFADLPTSTEQILHPEKYWKERDNPTLVTFPRAGAAYDLLDNDVFGEFGVDILLEELGIGRSRSKKASEGWDGDRYHAYEKGGKVYSVWYSTWDSAADAREFYTACLEALQGKYAGTEIAEKSRATKEKDVEHAIMEPGEGRIVRFERRGADVLVIDG
ncbi:MAG: hypothetical protein ACYTAF_14200, partial [Planctomycetota bacterium]